ncbi:hypothetical protein SELMODRAFT_419497 [Selaginella moellendorffii]|uniref:Uncharacterized protein n=1 Tax=Selaginella moellendorffii TaxID=88036 RepID=D8S950_SELML|nr:vegetative cell wall protein gp1 [Selaginella moellendorffii]EFJ19141.1 hypothetical protein SELMODRAFT_419497 [Selaginella moellendorffii]|eukprot:XP_002979739.1 vegetative cell wall protein gp1 [Selaginella moellendorffii]
MVLHSLLLAFILAGLSSATRKDTITVTGVVFCKRCVHGTAVGTPLPGVEVSLQYTGNPAILALTDSNGVFKLPVKSAFFADPGAKSRQLFVKIVRLPDSTCQIPTTTEKNAGILSKAARRTGIFTVGAFTFRPQKTLCSELPPSLSNTSIIPPLPPAIFPFPHPGYGGAPPIGSSPFLPFSPPPYEELPPPPNAEPPEIVIPPQPTSPPPPHSLPPAPVRRNNGPPPPLHALRPPLPPPAPRMKSPHPSPPAPYVRDKSPPPLPKPPARSKSPPRPKLSPPPPARNKPPPPLPKLTPPPPRNKSPPPLPKLSPPLGPPKHAPPSRAPSPGRKPLPSPSPSPTPPPFPSPSPSPPRKESPRAPYLPSPPHCQQKP